MLALALRETVGMPMLTEAVGIDPGQSATSVRHSAMSEPSVRAPMTAGFRHVWTPASVWPSTKGVMSSKHRAKGSSSAKPVKLLKSLHLSGSCARQPGVELTVAVVVAVAVVEEAVSLVLEAVIPGQSTDADKQSTMLWPLARTETSAARHSSTAAVVRISRGRDSVQELRPEIRPSPLALARFSQSAGSTFKQSALGDAVVNAEVLALVLERVVLVDRVCSAHSKALSRQSTTSEPGVFGWMFVVRQVTASRLPPEVGANASSQSSSCAASPRPVKPSKSSQAGGRLRRQLD